MASAKFVSIFKVWVARVCETCSADKLQQRSVKCIFVGYPKETMGYYFYFPPENKVIVARSERTKRAPNRLCLNMEVEDDVVCDLGEPANYKTAMLDPDKAALKPMGLTTRVVFSVAYIRVIWILMLIAAYYDMRFVYANFKDLVMCEALLLRHEFNNALLRNIFRCTWPDVAFAQKLGQSISKEFQESSTGGVKHILKQCVKGDTEVLVRIMSFSSLEEQQDWKSKKRQIPLQCMQRNLSTWMRQKLQWKPFGLGSLLEILE
ncbi:hypothetical protein Tco_0605886 [Tanacetum coccineum]